MVMGMLPMPKPNRAFLRAAARMPTEFRLLDVADKIMWTLGNGCLSSMMYGWWICGPLKILVVVILESVTAAFLDTYIVVEPRRFV